MPAGEAVFTITSDMSDVLRDFQRTQQQILRTNLALQRTAQAGLRTQQATRGLFAGALSSARSLVEGLIGAGGVVGALHLVMQASQEWQHEAVEAGKTMDEAFRKFRVQAGLRGLEAEKAQKRIEQIALQLPISETPVVSAEAAARQLVSSGFSVEEATGESLREFLKLMGASTLTGKDVEPREMAQAIASYMSSQGLELNAQNLRRVGRGVQALFKSTNIQVADLQQFAKQAATFEGALSIEEQLAMLALARQSFPAEESTTGLRNFILRLQTAGKEKAKVKALQQLGLRPEDVDLVGESIGEVLKRLRAGYEQAPEKDRAAILATLFGDRTVAASRKMIKGSDIFEEMIAKQKAGEFDKDVREAFSGRTAAARRAAGRGRLASAAQDDLADVYEQEMKNVAKEIGMAPAQYYIKMAGYKLARGFGATPEQALWFGFGDNAYSQAVRMRARTSQAYIPSDEELAEMRRQAQAQQKALQEIAENTRKTENNTRGPTRAKRPAAAMLSGAAK